MASPKQRFHATIVEYLDNTASCVDDLYLARLVDFKSGGICEVRNIIDKKKLDLMELFIEQHGNWEKIYNRDMTFVSKDFPVMYSYLGEEMIHAISSPFEVFDACEKTGKKCPLTKEDIDLLWYSIAVMVRIACSYVKSEGKSKYPDIDIERYTKMFEVTK